MLYWLGCHFTTNTIFYIFNSLSKTGLHLLFEGKVWDLFSNIWVKGLPEG